MKNRNAFNLIRNNSKWLSLIIRRNFLTGDLKNNIFVILTVTLLPFFFPTKLNAQELKEAIDRASVIYVAPVTGQYYYAVYLDPYTINEPDSIPVYEKNKDYKVNDILKITATSNSQFYVFVKVIGKIPDEFIDKFNRVILDSCKNLFGAEKVMSWPEGRYMDEKLGGYDEKAVECDFYVTPELIVSTKFKPFDDNMLFSNSGNLIGFQLVPFQENRYNVRELELFPNYLKLGLFQKTKPDKKGSKTTMVTRQNLFEEHMLIGVIKPEAEITTETSEPGEIWEKFDMVSNDICMKNQHWFEENMGNAANAFLQEIKADLSK